MKVWNVNFSKAIFMAKINVDQFGFIHSKGTFTNFLFYDYVAVPFPHAELNRWQNNFPPCFSSSGSPVAFFDKTLVEHFLYSTSFLRIFLPRISNFTGRFQSADLKYTTLIYHILTYSPLPMKLFLHTQCTFEGWTPSENVCNFRVHFQSFSS